MEIKIMFPGGGYFEWKWEPMSWDRFRYICYLIGGYIVGSGMLKLAALAVRA